MEEEKEKILTAVSNIYLHQGFYKTSMDEVAKQLGVSKKTIYKHFATKDSLAEEVVKNVMLRIGKRLDEIVSADATAIEKIITHMDFINNTVFKYSDIWANDLRDHLPHLWNKIDEFRAEKIQNYLSKIIEQGKKEGTFEDIPTEIVTTVLIASARAVTHSDMLSGSNISFREGIRITFKVLFGGILTTKGERNFKKLFKEKL
jgi:AcrR family transcriptional regulator